MAATNKYCIEAEVKKSYSVKNGYSIEKYISRVFFAGFSPFLADKELISSK